MFILEILKVKEHKPDLVLCDRLISRKLIILVGLIGEDLIQGQEKRECI